MPNTSTREALILTLLSEADLSIAEILEALKKTFEKPPSRVTIIRDLNSLVDQHLIERQGGGRSTNYSLSKSFRALKLIDIQKYFSAETDQRTVYERYNPEVISSLENILSQKEKEAYQALNTVFQKNYKDASETIHKRELERLTIELSWKSSKIEGNTYSLLETELLIKENKEAQGHDKSEAVMILNHKKVLEYIFANKSYFQKISPKKIEEIHELLTQDLSIKRGLRKSPVGIVGTRYKPLDNKFQIQEALKEISEHINRLKFPLEKALILSMLLSYLQAFEDGNKRTSRMSANAVLIAHDFCPLSYRNVDELEYKKAVILFYEQNNISYFKELFLGQFKFAVENYYQ